MTWKYDLCRDGVGEHGGYLVDSGFLCSATLQRVNCEVIHHIKKTDHLLVQFNKITKFQLSVHEVSYMTIAYIKTT